ncbi:MAG: chromosome partitioning protein ParA [Nitrospira sp. SG-bin1]|nr:MAG: chromosome partitioning protein ParA [Nitrospira sp. SG-bin1]
MKSAIYTGHVRHRRFSPVSHAFTYRLFMMYVDLDELPTLFQNRWFWSVNRTNLASFNRADHVGDPTIPLGGSIRQLVEERTGSQPAGPIRLLTHLRYFGYVFNPVSFYFCYDRSDRCVETIVAEITNTPWGERHCYVLSSEQNRASGRKKRYQFDKIFHISPFIDMDVAYDWRFTEPTSQLAIHMENLRKGQPFFDATMKLERREISGTALARVLVQYPLMTAKVISAIRWQALKLWMKGAPFYAHPKKRTEPSPVATSQTPS